MRTLRRVTSTMLALAMLMAMTTVPAFAAVLANATITTPEILSGNEYSVTVKITNTGSNGGTLGLGTVDSSLNAFQIEVPAAILDAPNVTLPANWSGGFDAEVGFIWAVANNDAAKLAPGASFNVVLTGTADRNPTDRTRNVPVFVSADGGMTLHSAGTPALTSRILQVVSASVKKPGIATNTNATQVTEFQDNATIEVGVINHGSAAVNTTVSLPKVSGTNATTTAQTVSIAGNSTRMDLSFPVTFGAAGSVVLDATATAATSPASAAVPFRLATITVQPKIVLAYVLDSLTPNVLVQGRDYALKLRVNKTGAQPSINLSHTLTFKPALVAGGTGEYSVTKAMDVGPGTNNNLTIEFPSKVVDTAFDNGTFAASMTSTGSDGNGATVSITIGTGEVILDALAPVVTLVADVGAPAVTGAEKAAGNGRPVTFTGDVKLGAGGAVCPNCTISAARLVVNKSDGTTSELPLNLTLNNQGKLNGNQSFTFPAGAVSAYGEVTVAKPNTLTGATTSNTFVVDIVAPKILEARTQRSANGDSILVTMDELVNASGTRASDWTVGSDNVVTAVTPVGNINATTKFVLELARPLQGTNSTPNVSYSRVGVNSPVFDRVALNLLNQVIKAVDGINPASAILETVSTADGDGAYGLQGGSFYTNSSKPTVKLSNLVAGDVITLWWDLDDNGAVSQGDQRLVEADATGSTTEVTVTSDMGNVSATHKLLAVISDKAGNTADLTTAPLALDLAAPEIASFEASGNNITVTFTEVLPRGRDAAFDWQAYADQNGEFAYRTVTQVTVSENGLKRVLTVAGASFDPSKGSVTGVRYSSRAPADQQYEDRATNEMLTQKFGSFPENP